MENIKEYISTGGMVVLYGLTLWLIKYIISQKDRQTEKVSNDIVEIKESLAVINSSMAIIKTQIETNNRATEKIVSKIDDMNKTLHQVQLEQNSILEWRRAVDRELETFRRLILERLP